MKKKPIEQNTELFVGAYLGSARAKAGIPLEQAAKDTRIRTQRLREIESDDFSGFVHPTYVRLFLLDYAAYLGVPLEEIRPMLPDRTGLATGGFQYLNVLATPDNKKPKTEPKRPRHRLLVFFGALAVLFIILVIGFSIWLAWRKVERVALSVPIPEPVAEVAKASPTPGGNATATPAAADPAATGGVILEMTTPDEPADSEPPPGPSPDASILWPATAGPQLPALPATMEATPTPFPSPTPTPTPKPARRHSR